MSQKTVTIYGKLVKIAELENLRLFIYWIEGHETGRNQISSVIKMKIQKNISQVNEKENNKNA